MGWKKRLTIVRTFDDVFTRLSARVETANYRGEQLAWKNYRQWYQKLVRDTKQSLRQLKKNFSTDPDMTALLTSLETSLRNVFDIDSASDVKWADINSSKTIWQRFKAAVDHKIKQEYDPFNMRNYELDEKLCFVLMPFDKAFDSVYTKAIRPAITKSRLKAKRADEIFRPTPIVQDIWEYINRATLLIADVTGRNPNVFYEVGLGHALPKRLIIVTQKKEDVPFDLQHIRWIRYTNTVSGREKLRLELQRTIKSILA